MFMHYFRAEIINAISRIRESRGSLSGLNMEEIIDKALPYLKTKVTVRQTVIIEGLFVSHVFF